MPRTPPRPDRSALGRTVTVIVDRPLGSAHPEHPELIYPVNYGYIPGTLAGDGEAQDAYLLGLPGPAARGTGTVIAILHRRDDVEDKWVVLPPDVPLPSDREILSQVSFQERWFDTVLLRD